MLKKSNSAPFKALSYGLVLPLVMVFFTLFDQAPVIAQTIDKAHLEYVKQLESNGWISQDTVTTFDPNTKQESVKIIKNDLSPINQKSGEPAYLVCDKMPSFPGGQSALIGFLVANTVYPKSAIESNTEGTIMLTFIVNKEGAITELSTLNKESTENKVLIEEAKRIGSLMPNWVPGEHKGKKVSCKMTLPVKFKLEGQKTEPALTLNFVDIAPEFTGGQAALFQYLATNIVYPPAAVKEKAEGMVVVEFVIEKDGSVIDVTPLRVKDIRQDFIDEAVRVVKAMPKWKPAIKDREVVKVKYTLPIRFKLN